MLALAVTAAIIGIGCGGGATGQALSGTDATFVTFGGAIGDAIERAYGNPVAQKTGLQLSYDSPTTYSKLQTQVETGNVSWTVIEADPWWSRQNCDQLLEPMTDSVNLEAIDQRFVIDRCGIPGDTFAFLWAYDAEKFGDTPPDDWADFFNVDKYSGTRALWGSFAVNGALEGPLLADGVRPKDLYPLDLDRAFAKLDTIRDDVVFYETPAQAEEMMVNHEVPFILTSANQNGYDAESAGANYDPVWNQAILSWDSYIVPKGANTEAAEALLDRIVTPEAQSQLASIVPYGTTLKNPPSIKELAEDPALKKWSLANPDNLALTVPQNQSYYAKHYDEINSRWTEWVAGG